MKTRLGSALALAAALIACGPPKYVNYWSYWRDWRGTVPWGWKVLTDTAAGGYASTSLVGPFAPEFFLAQPSFTVRYYPYRMPHALADGSTEYYADVDDYIQKTLKGVYGGTCAQFSEKPRPVKETDTCQLVDDRIPEKDDEAENHAPVGQPETIKIGHDNLDAVHFTVFSPAAAPAGARYGLSVDPKTKNKLILRLHEYVVVPMKGGFYVLVYPATQRGFRIYKKQFNALVHSFLVAKDGPLGPSTGVSFTSSAAAPAAPAASKTGQ